MIEFTVVGPFKIHVYKGKGGRTITDQNIDRFWESNKKYGKRRGCYIFAIRAGKGLTPGYVGKATKKFKQEVFAYHKLTRYQQFLVDYGKGTPVLFFVVAPVKKGKPNAKQIGRVERYLIHLASTANSGLLNVKGATPDKWAIKGVIRGGKGKTSRGTRDFRSMLRID